jgi:hypothetical protein
VVAAAPGAGTQSRIYKTTDAGEHWTLQYTNREPTGFYDCMDFWDANHGIAIGDAIGNQIAMLTTTNGITWTACRRRRFPRHNLGRQLRRERDVLVTQPLGARGSSRAIPRTGECFEPRTTVARGASIRCRSRLALVPARSRLRSATIGTASPWAAATPLEQAMCCPR